jgi:hypothetical protein
MNRLAVMFSLLALLGLVACSGGDTGEGTTSGDEPAPVSAQKAGAPAAPAPTPEAAKAAPADPQVQSCLDLVAEAKFSEAVPVCTAALRSHPGNAEVKKALAEAQAGVAKLADAKGAAAAAAQGAASDAQGAADAAASDAASKAVEGAMPKVGQ